MWHLPGRSAPPHSQEPSQPQASQARAPAVVHRGPSYVTPACRAHLCVGGYMPASMASMCTDPAAALWEEVAGRHVDQSAQGLRYLHLPPVHAEESEENRLWH